MASKDTNDAVRFYWLGATSDGQTACLTGVYTGCSPAIHTTTAITGFLSVDDIPHRLWVPTGTRMVFDALLPDAGCAVVADDGSRSTGDAISDVRAAAMAEMAPRVEVQCKLGCIPPVVTTAGTTVALGLITDPVQRLIVRQKMHGPCWLTLTGSVARTLREDPDRIATDVVYTGLSGGAPFRVSDGDATLPPPPITVAVTTVVDDKRCVMLIPNYDLSTGTTPGRTGSSDDGAITFVFDASTAMHPVDCIATAVSKFGFLVTFPSVIVHGDEDVFSRTMGRCNSIASHAIVECSINAIATRVITSVSHRGTTVRDIAHTLGADDDFAATQDMHPAEVAARQCWAIACRLNALPLTHQLAKTCGCPWNAVLEGARVRMSDTMLMHAYTADNVPFPNERGRGDDEAARVGWVPPVTGTRVSPGGRRTPPRSGAEPASASPVDIAAAAIMAAAAGRRSAGIAEEHQLEERTPKRPRLIDGRRDITDADTAVMMTRIRRTALAAADDEDASGSETPPDCDEDEDDNTDSGGSDPETGSEAATANPLTPAPSTVGTYKGGHVITPTLGLHGGTTFLALLDFSSMYPSIVRGFLVCPTNTALRGPALSHTEFPDCDVDAVMSGDRVVRSAMAAARAKLRAAGAGVMPQLFARLIRARNEVKKELARALASGADAATIAVLRTREQSYKLAANQTYGCLGTKGSRFYNTEVAAEITRCGRFALAVAVHTAVRMGYKVIYGDTDSIMIATGSMQPEAARAEADAVSAQVTDMLSDFGLVMVPGGVYSAALIVSKKQYAVLHAGSDTKIDIHGLDSVRRDRCDAARIPARVLIESILTGVRSGTLTSSLTLAATASQQQQQASDPAVRPDSRPLCLRWACQIAHNVATHARANVRASSTSTSPPPPSTGDTFGIEGLRGTMADYAICAWLSKNPRAYGTINAPPHVHAARWSRGTHAYRKGDSVTYTMHTGGIPVVFGEAAPDKAPLDIGWYLGHQVLPALCRVATAACSQTSTVARPVVAFSESDVSRALRQSLGLVSEAPPPPPLAKPVGGTGLRMGGVYTARRPAHRVRLEDIALILARTPADMAQKSAQAFVPRCPECGSAPACMCFNMSMSAAAVPSVCTEATPLVCSVCGSPIPHTAVVSQFREYLTDASPSKLAYARLLVNPGWAANLWLPSPMHSTTAGPHSDMFAHDDLFGRLAHVLGEFG